MARYATIGEYIDAVPAPLVEVAQAAREAIDAALPDAQTAIKWAHPTWSLGRRPVCYLKAASGHITVGFWRGASIDDPSGRLQTSGQVMAHVKLRTAADVDRACFADWLSQARSLEEQARAS
jgi:hypothetical protein